MIKKSGNNDRNGFGKLRAHIFRKNGCINKIIDIVFFLGGTKTASISRSQLIRGGYCIPGFLKTFLKKIRFLSDQEVPGRHKNIYRELRRFFTRSEIFGNMCCFFRQQTQHLLPSLGTGSPKAALWEFVGKVIFSLFDPKNRFSAFNGPINIAGGRLDILFHFPNDWYNNIEG